MRQVIIALGNRLPESMVSQFRSDTRLARLVRPIVNRTVPESSQLIVIGGGKAKGIKLLIEPRREKYYWTGLHEPHVQDAIVQNVREGDTFWDIGAHIGLMSLLAAQRVGPTGAVHAFEPMSKTRDRLRYAVEANGVQNIQVHSEAVSGTSGEKVLYAHPQSVKTSLHPSRQRVKGEQVTCVTLDELCARLGSPHLVKIDAEGAELEVLTGGAKMLKDHPNVRCIVEFTDEARLQGAQERLPNHTFSSLGANHWLLVSQNLD